MIFPIFSIFFTVILGASTAFLGLVEGLSDFAASSLDYLSGYFSDRLGKRKIFAVIGYGFSTLAKCLLLFTNSVFFASSFRVIERFGKSFRGPPRDAWISSFTTNANRGFSFGIHKAFDKAGAILGPLIAFGILSLYGQSKATFSFLFAIALIPAVLSVVILLFLKDQPVKPSVRRSPFAAYNLTSPGFRHYLKTSGIFSLAYFSFAFFLLKAYAVGFTLAQVTLLYAFFNLVFVITAPLFGQFGDRVGRRIVLFIEYGCYALLCFGFLFAQRKSFVVLLFFLFGIFYAIDESQSRAYITDLEKKNRATALGIYNFVTGILYFIASFIAGSLWMLSPQAPFLFGCIVSLFALFYFSLK